jgi:hypothetical protein
VERIRSIAEWMAERGLGLDELLNASGLERRVLEAIVHGRYTPSPQQRLRVAGAVGVDPGQVAWGHTTPVEHIQGHGPQFGRSP